MASEIRVGLVIDSKGTMTVNAKQAAELKRVLEEGRKASVELSKGLSSPEATKALEAKVALSKQWAAELNKVTTESRAVERALKNVSGSPIDSGLNRGATGAGGRGDTRDFARQAQGLGGLVHLYATFAANIFAVTAAFTGLERAFQAQRLTESADVIGSKIGVNVRGIAQDLQKATGYAINFKDALEFTNTGIGVGLTGKQIKNLTVIAKGAANALGRDTTDSVQRIIRGTAKQEQEILDELGIFVKAKQAYKDYADARQIVDENTLSATQKVAAYAEAVEKAGAKWKEFADIKDPFSKFKASITEVAISIANVFNKAFVPIISVLADYPSIITGIMLATVTKLASVAVPRAKEVMASLFIVDKKVIEAQVSAATSAIVATLEAKKAALIGKVDPDTSSLKQSVSANKTLGGLGLDGFIAADLVRRRSLTEQLTGEKSLQAAASQRLATIYNINKVETRNAEIRKLQESGLFNIDQFNRKITLSAQGQLAAESEIRAIIAGNNKELVVQKGLKAQIALLDKEILATSTVGLKVTQDANIALLNQEVLNSSILGLQNSILAKTTIIGKLQAIGATDLGVVFKNTQGQLLAKTMAAGKLAVAGLGQALTALVPVMGWILTAWALWDIAFKPILTSMGAFSKQTEIAREAIDRLGQTNTVVKKTLEDTTGALNTQGTTISELTQKAKVLANMSVEVQNALADAFKEYKEAQKRPGWLDNSKNLGVDFAAALSESIANEIRNPDSTSSKKMLEAWQTNLKNVQSRLKGNSIGLRYGFMNNPEDEAKKLEEITIAFQKSKALDVAAAEKSSQALQIVEQRNKNITDSITKVQEDILNNKDKQLALIKNDNIQTVYKELRTSLNSLGDGTNTINTLRENFSKLPDSLIKGITSLETMKYVLDGIAKSTPEVQKALYKNLPALLAPLLGEGMASLDKSLDKPKKDKEKVDIQARLFRQSQAMDIAKNASIKTRIAFEDMLAAKEIKRTGLIKEGIGTEYEKNNLINSRLRSTEESIQLEKKIAIAAAEEARRLSVRTKESSASKAQELFDATKLNIITEANYKTLQARDKAEEERKANKKVVADATFKQEMATNSIYEKSFEIQKALGKLTEKEYLDKKYTNDLLKIEKQYQLDIVDDIGGAKKAILDSEKASKLEILELERDSLETQRLRNEATQELSNIQEKISIAIDTARKYNKSTVALEIKAQQNILDNMYSQLNLTSEIGKQEEIRLKTYKELLANLEAQEEARKRNFQNEDNKPQIVYDEAARQARDFASSMKDTVTGTFDAVYAGMDAAIDELTTKWMKSEKVSIKDLVLTFRNTMAEEIRKMAADQMKAEGRNLIKGILGKILPRLNFDTNEEKALKAAEITASSTAFLATQAGMDATILDGITEKIGETKEASVSIFDTIKERLFSFGSTVIDIFRALGTNIGSIFAGVFNAGGSGGSSVGLGDLFSSGGLGSILGAGNDGVLGGGTGILGALTNFGSSIGSFFGFANGGIMTEYGPLKLNKYSQGGIVNSPQLFMAGEGRYSEAQVPLPDGRSIPVTMTGPTGGQGVSINITVNATTGESKTTTQGSNTEDMKKLGVLISTVVKREIVEQQRSNGLLNKRT
jgi:hypothetical protein